MDQEKHRHKWEFLHNVKKKQVTETLRSVRVRFSLHGLYKCSICGGKKLGTIGSEKVKE